MKKYREFITTRKEKNIKSRKKSKLRNTTTTTISIRGSEYLTIDTKITIAKSILTESEHAGLFLCAKQSIHCCCFWILRLSLE